ncbi:MAG: GNAT family N-acetyltransferase [Phycisphaerales bacterium]
MITYKQITKDDPLYPGECRLRERVLLSPIGYDMDRFVSEYPGFEDKFEHFVATTKTPGGDRVIGCALLLPDTDRPGFGKLMQMAVDPQRQGEGIGRRLVIEVESAAFGEMGLEGIYCHAQTSAISFYERLGWSSEGDEFDEAGIPHLKMVITRPPVEANETPIPGW